jgi:deazaflavin-dependent oxidoreductase (nitroreductase family)
MIMSTRAKIANRISPFVQPMARRVPPFAVLHHRGRRTGRGYDTPVQAYPTPQGGYVVGLGYGYNSAWVLNLLAAEGGEMTRGGRRYKLTNPRRAKREALNLLPRWTSLMLRAMRIDDYMQFDATPLD